MIKGLSEHETLWLKEAGAEMLRDLGMKEGYTALDFGCGEGRYTTPLSQITGEKGCIYAVERDKEVLKLLHERLDAFSSRQMVNLLNMEDLASIDVIPEESIDFILAFDVLQYIEDWEQLFSCFYRVSKQNATLVIYPAAVPHPGAVDMERVKSILEKTGFILKEEKDYHMMHNVFMENDRVFCFTKV